MSCGRAIVVLLLIVASPAVAGGPASTSADRIGADVMFLADDLLEGRATGSRGHDIAARYVAAQMRLLGLKPGARNGSWLQPVPMLEATRVVPTARVVVRRESDSVGLVPAVDFMPVPGFFSDQARVEARMVFVGFGISAPEFGYDDFRGVDLRGKVAVFLNGLPPAVPASLRVFYTKQRARQLAERGAAGSVEIPFPVATDAPRRWQTFLSSPATKFRLLDTEERPVDAYPGLDASIVLSADSAPKIFAGSPKDLEAIWSEARAGKSLSFELPATISIETQSALRRMSSVNVIGLLEGSSRQIADEYVVLMAHLDHLGVAAVVGDRKFYNGALDNAAGVAVMLEAARLLVDADQRPRRSILFIATTAEERGLLGSRQFALNPTVRKDGIVAVVNIDMPVPLYPPAGYTAIGAEHSTLGEVARRALEAEGLAILPIKKPERGLFAFTDQYSFVQEGIPALYVHETPLSSDPSIDADQVFEGFLRDHYHKPGDDAALPIDWNVLARLARVNARICQLISDDSKRPRWLPGDFYGGRFGRL